MFGHSFELLEISFGLSLPDLPNLLHDVQGRDIGHLNGHLGPRLSHKEHVRCQWLLRHLVQESVVLSFAELSQLGCEPIFVTFSCLLIFLFLSLGKLLPFFGDHLDDFSDSDPGVLLLDHDSLLHALGG